MFFPRHTKKSTRAFMFLFAYIAIIFSSILVIGFFIGNKPPKIEMLIINGYFYFLWIYGFFLQKNMDSKFLKIVVPVIVFLAFTIFFFSPDINSKQINENYSLIEKNFESIKNLPGAERLPADDIDSMKKSNLVYIGGDFKSDASYEVIKNYYMAELNNEGWEFVSEESEKDWGKDYGVKDLNFKKDEMELALTYAPPNQQENYGYNFSVSIDLEF